MRIGYALLLIGRRHAGKGHVKIPKKFPRTLTWAMALSLVASAGFARGAEAPANEPLARLLAAAGDEPLATVAFPDLRKLPQILNASAVGKIYHDVQYGGGREAAEKLLADWTGAEVKALWDALIPHLTGPAALVLTQTPAEKTGDPPQLQAILLIAVIDAEGAQAVKQAWPKAAPQANSPFAFVKLDARPAKELTEAAAWSKETAATPGFLRVRMRPRALREAFKGLEKASLPPWMEQLKAVAEPSLERATLDSELEGTAFLDRVTLELAEKAEGAFPALLRSLRAKPRPWNNLMAALPGGQEISLLAQADFKAMGESLNAGMQALERELRGKKWTRLHGDEEETTTPSRFDFITGPLSGAIGFAGGMTLTGEPHIVSVAATNGIKPGDFRASLIENLGLLGGEFQTKEKSARIGDQAPIAAAFQGRGLMPAPVIGLSEGWVWLCSNTTAYNDLTAAFGSSKVMSTDPLPPPVLKPPEPAAPADPSKPEVKDTPGASTFRLDVNLNAVLPMVYAAWLLSPEGPKIGGWKVPEALLPKNPGIFNKRFGHFLAELARDGNIVLGAARGPVPGVGLAPVAFMAACAQAIEDLKERRAAALREKAKLLNEIKTPEAPVPPAPEPGK